MVIPCRDSLVQYVIISLHFQVTESVVPTTLLKESVREA